MLMRFTSAATALAAALFAPVAIAQPPVEPAYSYADLADLSEAAPVAADVTVHDAIRLKGANAATVPPGKVRFYIVADVQALIRGAQGLPGQVTFLADLPLVANRPPKLKKNRYLILGTPVAGKPGQLQLAGPAALIAWTPEIDQRLRGILAAINAPDAPPRITGVGHAFHVPGSLPGESETQIFLTTADGRPVSLNILRRPGEQPRWAVALGEIVDAAARPPAPETLLWYRLACFLPRTMPADSTADLAPADAEATQTDYALVLAGLGPCVRNNAGS
jgi:hypothetical protein